MNGTDTRHKRTDGVRTLADLHARCVIDAESGCWLWRGAFNRNGRGQPTSRVWLPRNPGVAAVPAVMTGQRAAWLLAGNTLRKGHLVWRHVCWRPDCVNPDHMRSGSRLQMNAAIRTSGHMRGDPVRAAINAKNRQSMLVPVEKVREVERMFAEGALLREVKERTGLAFKTCRSIRDGLHPHSAGSVPHAVAAASVFHWARAA